MAKLPSIVRLSREDYKDAPSWFERFLTPMNTFIRTVYEALNGNLTFGDNVAGFEKEFTITAGAAATDNTATFSYSLKKEARGLLLMRATQTADNYTPVAAAVGLSWRKGNGEIIIDAISGLTNGNQYTIRVLVI